jgi:hypothetical protein
MQYCKSTTKQWRGVEEKKCTLFSVTSYSKDRTIRNSSNLLSVCVNVCIKTFFFQILTTFYALQKEKETIEIKIDFSIVMTILISQAFDLIWIIAVNIKIQVIIIYFFLLLNIYLLDRNNLWHHNHYIVNNIKYAKEKKQFCIDKSIVCEIMLCIYWWIKKGKEENTLFTCLFTQVLIYIYSIWSYNGNMSYWRPKKVFSFFLTIH